MTYKGKQVVRQIVKNGIIHEPAVVNGNLLIPMWQVEPRRTMVFYYEIPGELIRKICKKDEKSIFSRDAEQDELEKIREQVMVKTTNED